jgi:hypothetical protein
MLGFKSAIILNRGQELEIHGQLMLTTAPFGVEMGAPFLVDAASQNVFPMTFVKMMHR